MRPATQQQTTILLVEDSANDALLIERALDRGGVKALLYRVDNREDLNNALRASNWDLIIADYVLPAFGAPELLKILGERQDDTPVIIVSGSIGEERAVEAMKSGACDYLLKDNLARLPSAVLREIKAGKVRRAHRGMREELRQSEEHFRILLDTLKDYHIFTLDPEGRVATWNAAAERVTGYSSEEILGRDFACFFPKEDIQSGRPARVLRTAAALGRYEEENIRVRKDGSAFWAYVVITPLRDASGLLRGYAKVSRDATERRVLENQVRQAQKMDAIGQLAGGVAHDFNNLLTLIVGYGQRILQRSGPAQGDLSRADAEIILKTAETAAALTRQLLAFSRNQVLEPKVLNLNRIIQDMEKMLRRLIGEHIELASSLAQDLGNVKVDPSQIEQVLLNLAVNARDAMPKGGKIGIATRNVAIDEARALRTNIEPGPYVLLSVSDSGCGVAPEIQTRIFEPFFTTKERGKGTGLGLSTVYGIVKQSGGSISVSSAAGRGATFDVLLPQVAEPANYVPAKSSQASAARVGTETILLVEDDQAVRELARAILEGFQYVILEAPNGAEALRIFEQQRDQIALIVTDTIMPVMSGPELGRRATAIKPDVKILYVSGYPEDSLPGNLGPASEFLQKPFSPQALASRVRAMLDANP